MEQASKFRTSCHPSKAEVKNDAITTKIVIMIKVNRGHK